MRARPVVVVTVLAAIIASLGAASPSPLRPSHDVKEPVAVGTGGAVASAEFNASEAGIPTLRSGGNAIDAAVAVASTLGVTEPFVAGPGGGGFMAIYLAKTHQVVTIDGREMCAAACTPRLFIDPATGTPLAFEDARHSGLSVGVPGMVATWDKAVRNYGTRSFAADLGPAIGVAQRGFNITPDLVLAERAALQDLQAFTSSRRLFLTSDGQPLPVGSTLRNPDLARTYQLLAQHGAGYPYGGSLGVQIADTVRHPPVWSGTPLTIRPGLMTASDVANYRAKLRAPTHVAYRGLDVYRMVPPSSGGLTTGEALNILQGWDLSSEPRAQALLQYLESSRLAFADRNAYIGDSDFVPVPQHGLLDPAFAATRRCPVPGRGFLLNNEMTDFDFAAAAPGTYDPNLPASGKRPRSSMNPTIVLKNGVPDFSIGSPGGSTILPPVLQTLLNHIDSGRRLPQATAAPRGRQRNAAGTDAEADFYSSALAQQLTSQYGEHFKLQTGAVLPLNSWIGNATGIQFLPGGRFQAAAEPVRLGGGSALVVNAK